MVRILPPVMSFLIGFPSENKAKLLWILLPPHFQLHPWQTRTIRFPLPMPTPLRFRSAHGPSPGHPNSCSSSSLAETLGSWGAQIFLYILCLQTWHDLWPSPMSSLHLGTASLRKFLHSHVALTAISWTNTKWELTLGLAQREEKTSLLRC